MLKVKNIIIIFVINYLLLLVVTGIFELHALSERSQHIQTTIHTAADMALQQVQVIDDFLAYGDREAYSILAPAKTGDGFIKQDLFEAVFGIPSYGTGNQEAIFQRLYNNDTFLSLANRTGAIRIPVKYWNATKTGFEWHTIPKVTFIGTDLLPYNNSTQGVKNLSGSYLPQGTAAELYKTYKLDNHIKVSNGKEYYNTPLNFGITYLNEELLQTLFMNNLDILMRSKYETNLNSTQGGNGIIRGETYADKVTSELDTYNPINDGIFSILRGTPVSNNSNVTMYKGIKPTIEYRVIDMYDSQNDTLLVHLFGAKTDGNSSKAVYLKQLDSNVINPVTNRPYDSKPIVVAKVTFYVDVVVPYFNFTIRELRATVGGIQNNYLDLVPKNSIIEGSRRMEYTRYFAVTP